MTPTRDPLDAWRAAWRGDAVPTLAVFLGDHPDLDASAVASACAIDLRQHRRRGHAKRAEDYLSLRPDLLSDPEAVVELAYTEYVAREAAGERPEPAEFAARFPDFADRIRQQLKVHGLFGDLPDPDPAWTTLAPEGSGDTADPISTPAPTAGVRVGRYHVVSRLDAGAQGMVFRAVHPELQTEVVLKVGRPGGAGGAESLRAEGRVLAGLDHPNLARVIDLDVHDGRPFLAIEYVRGRNLRQVAADRQVPPAEAARVVAAVARAADHAHGRGVIHRDIKPANIVMEESGRPRLVDFGLALVNPGVTDATAPEGMVSGTVAFMAPEQARGEQVGPAADVFGLGGVLYFLLTGSAPAEGKTIAESLGRAARGDWDRAKLANPAVPAKLAAVCERAMATDPKARPTAAGFADELEAAVAPPKRWWPPVVATVVLLVGSMIFMENYKQSGTTIREAPPPLPAAKLVVKGWAGDRFVPLPDSAPLRTKQPVQVEAEVPPGHTAALFLWDSTGSLEKLADYSAAAAPTPVRFPEGKKSVPLTGRSGTEVVLLVSTPDGPVDVAEVTKLWSEPGPWPTLPELSVLHLMHGEVKVLQKGQSRAFGPAEVQADPEGEVRDRLTAAAKRLRARFPVVEAVAFRHAD